MFNDHAFRDGIGLAGVNSINWARVLAQTVYYFTAAVALGAPHRKVSFTVPTGNFGDVFAGWVAKRMGLPIDRLVDRDEPERHPAPHARDRRVPPRDGAALDQPVDGHPGQLQLRAPALRALRPRGRGRGGADDRALPRQRLPPRRRARSPGSAPTSTAPAPPRPRPPPPSPRPQDAPARSSARTPPSASMPRRRSAATRPCRW